MVIGLHVGKYSIHGAGYRILFHTNMYQADWWRGTCFFAIILLGIYNHPNWQTPSFVYSFFRGVGQPPTSKCCNSVPSGKLSHDYGKIHHFSWVNPLSTAIFNSFLYLYQALWYRWKIMLKKGLKNLSRIAEDPGRSSAVESQKFRVCAEVPGSSWLQLGFMRDPMGDPMVGWLI